MEKALEPLEFLLAGIHYAFFQPVLPVSPRLFQGDSKVGYVAAISYRTKERNYEISATLILSRDYNKKIDNFGIDLAPI